MAIREFSSEGTPRAKIAFVGGLPKAKDLNWFKKRNFASGGRAEACTLEKLRQSDLCCRIGRGHLDDRLHAKLNALPREMRATVLLTYWTMMFGSLFVSLQTNTLLTNTPRQAGR